MSLFLHPSQNQLFLDIFPIFRCPTATESIISHLTTHILTTYPLTSISSIICLEARGFFFAPLIASRLALPCIPIRKAGKLPLPVISLPYTKEYGSDSFEIKTDAFEGISTDGKKVILVDDLLGKGGSIKAAKELAERMGMEVAEAVFIFDIDIGDYREVNERMLGGLKRYAMITLTEENIGPIVNS